MSKIVLRGENKHKVRVCYTYLLVEYTLMDITKDIEFVNKHIDSVFNKIMQDGFVLNLIYNTTQKINNSIIGRVFLNTVDIITSEVLYNGTYINLIGRTIDIMTNVCGLKFYNEMILLQEPATAAMRSFNFMNSSRKIAKCHQQVLVFIKGDINETVDRLDKFNINNNQYENNKYF